MPGTFQFVSTFSSDSILSQARATNGPGVGIDDTTLASLLGGSFHFNDDQASITSVALSAGETVSLDVDFGGAGGIDNIDTRMYVIDSFGNVVANVGNSPVDVGSTSSQDPKLDFTAATAGVYFIAIVQTSNSYVNGTFEFSGGGTDGGDFTFNAGFAGLSTRTFGTLNDDTVSLTLGQRRYDGRSGNDQIYANTASTTIDGGEGNDYLQGSSGRDTLFGGDGNDTLYGSDGNDMIIGGTGSDYIAGDGNNDTLYGGSDSDTLDGGAGTDILFGENGDDYLYDGAGNDKVYGAAGKRLFL